MAQTTTAVSIAAAFAAVSTNGSSWTSLGPALVSITPSGGDQLTGSQNTADGGAPVVVNANKTGMVTAEVRALYTEDAAEAWEIVSARYEGAAKTIYFRYAPKGATAGYNLFTATDDAGNAFACPIINCLPPASDAGSGDPSMFGFSLAVPEFTQATYPT